MSRPARPWKTYARDAAFLACQAVAGRGDDRAVVLMYHRIGPGGVPVETFERQVAHVTGRFAVTTLRDLRSAREAAPAGSRVAVLTFDDGTSDHVERALPILDRHGVPGTFFPIVDRLDGAAGGSMTAAEVTDLARRGHEVGAHTCSHRTLPGLPDDRARREIEDSKARLEDLTGGEVASFAYPKGRYDRRVRSLVEAAGFAVAVTVDEAAIPRAPDWLALPRVAVQSSAGTVQFRAKLTRALDLYERLRGRGSVPAPGEA